MCLWYMSMEISSQETFAVHTSQCLGKQFLMIISYFAHFKFLFLSVYWIIDELNM